MKRLMYKARRVLGLGVYRVNQVGRWNYSYHETKREAVQAALTAAASYGDDWVVDRIDRNERVRRIVKVNRNGVV